MAKVHSTRQQKAGKVVRFYRHKRGWWAKKHSGRTYYLTKIEADPDCSVALKRWAIILQGGDPDAMQQAYGAYSKAGTVEDLCFRFLDAKKMKVDAGRMTARSLEEYRATGKRIAETFGRLRAVSDLTPLDFNKLLGGIQKQYGVHRTATEIQRVRSIFKWGWEIGLIASPVRFGPDFKKPGKDEFRKQRATRNRMVDPAALRAAVKGARPQVKAMLLLGINCGLGNDDCCRLPLAAIDLETGWLDFPRPKTGIERRAVLWPETLAALQAVKAKHKPAAGDVGKLWFRTKYGQPWTAWAVGHELRKLTAEFTFYDLRHTFKTIGEESGDGVATEFIMGHATDTGISGNYRARMSDDRLAKVAAHVHSWLFPAPAKRGRKGGAK